PRTPERGRSAAAVRKLGVYQLLISTALPLWGISQSPRIRETTSVHPSLIRFRRFPQDRAASGAAGAPPGTGEGEQKAGGGHVPWPPPGEGAQRPVPFLERAGGAVLVDVAEQAGARSGAEELGVAGVLVHEALEPGHAVHADGLVGDVGREVGGVVQLQVGLVGGAGDA